MRITYLMAACGVAALTAGCIAASNVATAVTPVAPPVSVLLGAAPGPVTLAAADTCLHCDQATAKARTHCGGASWYALTSRTASGERANPNAMAAAHRTLPFGTQVKVTNLNNGRSVMVRINDRGPFVKGRVIDVTKAAATKLGFVNAGVARVRVEVPGSGGTGTCT